MLVDSVVWEGRHLVDGTGAAIKENAMKIAMSEIFLLRKINHPNIIRFIDMNEFRLLLLCLYMIEIWMSVLEVLLTNDKIPVISLSGIDDVGGKKEDICRQIVEVFGKWGMFQAVDHGVDTNFMADMTRLARDFFALTTEEKLRFDMSGGKGGFGVSSHLLAFSYVGRGYEGLEGDSAVFHVPCDYSRWPDKPEGWLKVTEDYSERLMGLAYKVLEVLSEAMGLEKAALKNACVDMEQKIVVNYFPKRPKPDLALGMRHIDHGIITSLLQDQVSCLQATRDNGKTCVTVPLVPGALVINLGGIGHEVHDFRPSGGGGLKIEQTVHKHIPLSGSSCHRVSTKISEQQEVHDFRPSGGGGLKIEQTVHKHIPLSGSSCHRVSTK
ncbi:hypothetical protein F2Q69_00062642, partial [Brassica cretica]